MKSDRRHFKRPREPLARGDTSSESITQVTCHSWQWRGLPTQSRSHPERSEGSITLNQILRPEKAGLRMTDSLSGNPPLSKPPTGFSESDVGEPPDMECDIGRALDELASSELERTW